MPTYSIQAPDGKTYDIEGPEGATKADIAAQVLLRYPEAAVEKSKQTGIDMSKLATADLKAVAAGNMAGVSDAGLQILAGSASQPKQADSSVIGKTVAVTQAETTPIKPADANLGSVTTGAMFAAVAGLAAGILLHWVITRHLWRNPRVSAHQTGLWCGSIVASTSLMLGIGQLVNIAVLFKLTDEDWYKFGLQWSLLLPIIYFLIGYAAGWIFRRLKPLAVQTTGASPIAPSSSPAVVNGGIVRPVTADEDEELHLQAFNELNSTDRKPGLWAMALSQTANGGNPDGAYIALRVEQLRGERSGQRQSREQEALLLQERIKSQAANQNILDAITRFQNGVEPGSFEVKLLAKAATKDAQVALITDRIHGNNLLHWCALLGLDHEATTLLQHGADAASLNGDGQLPFQLARNISLASVLKAATTASHGTCPNPRCMSLIPLRSQECPKCGASFRSGSSWKLIPAKG